ncbi:proline dehydrogenase family protein [Providencia rettgeri]|nr:proline dehydrogenase family protein [Providencia rettgeri]
MEFNEMNSKTLSIYFRYTTTTLCIKYIVTLLLTYKITKRLSIYILKLMVKRNIKIITNKLNGIYFCGETLEQAKDVTGMLAKNNISSVLDYAVEGEEDASFFDEAVNSTLRLIELASSTNHMPYVVVKPSSLGSITVYQAKIKNDHNFLIYQPAWEKVLSRYNQIFAYAQQMSVCVMIDAEQSWFQPIIDKIAIENMLKYNKEKAVITLTLQCYKKSSYEFIQLMNKLAIKHNIKIGIKLVRGAYLEEELQRNDSASNHFFTSKPATDDNYNAIIEFIAINIENFTPFFATHNKASISKILENTRLTNHHYWLGQLYGVGDHISLNAVKHGARVCKYLPYGPFEKSLPYLLRRIEENAVSITTFRHENKLIRKEIISRIVGKNHE